MSKLHRRNPERHGSYPRDWGADVVGDFSSRNVASGAKSSRGIRGVHKPSAAKEVDATSSKELPLDEKTLEEGLMDKKTADP